MDTAVHARLLADLHQFAVPRHARWGRWRNTALPPQEKKAST